MDEREIGANFPFCITSLSCGFTHSGRKREACPCARWRERSLTSRVMSVTSTRGRGIQRWRARSMAEYEEIENIDEIVKLNDEFATKLRSLSPYPAEARKI